MRVIGLAALTWRAHRSDLAVARPIADRGSTAASLLNAGRRLDYYAGGKWGANADVVVQDLLVESLRNAGRLRSVQGDASAFVADYLMQSELNDFQAEYAAGGGQPIVRVTLVCTLGRVQDRHPLAAFLRPRLLPPRTTRSPQSSPHSKARFGRRR
jgi:ABC-type uncharacterized transport system auxiliary subunit